MLINPYVFSSYDANAAAWIASVEAADGQSLETGVKNAVNTFFVGCKSDGIWNAIKASCILAGARTLAGALVPLVGAAPTNINFVSADYNRKTGLLGNGSSKYLNANRSNAADPQNNNHIAVYGAATTSGNQVLIGARDSNTEVGAKRIAFISSSPNWENNQNADAADTAGSYTVNATSFWGNSRSSSTSYSVRVSGTNHNITRASSAPDNINLYVFAFNSINSPILHSPSRLSFYSIGESLDLALLDSHVTTLINAIAAAIP